MWNYEKRLQYPVKITQTNPKIAQIIITQFGGPDGELAASMRYLAQRYTMPYNEVTGTLTDIGTEELAHLEMICAIVHQLTRNLTPEEIEKYGLINIMLTIRLPSVPGCQRCTLDGNLFSIQRRSDYRSFMKIWLQTKAPDHL